MNEISNNLSKAKIMMVDDEPITMYVVQTFLEEFGYTTFRQVDDSKKAMIVLEEFSPDIILLDLEMPDISGFEILEMVRSHEKYKHLPVVILTGSTGAENKLKALGIGATDFLAKPVDQSELCLRVRNTLTAKAYMDQLAFYDPLTKLPNKHMFYDRFEWALRNAEKYGDRLALMNIGVDNFERLYATIGVDAADSVLLEISNRLINVVRGIDNLYSSHEKHEPPMSLFRSDGSTFLLLLNKQKTIESAALLAERILKSINSPVVVKGEDVYVTASIGVSTYPEEGNDSMTLRQLASSAKDFSFTGGGNSFHFSSEAINTIYQNRLNLENKLRRALEREEFVLYYQPKIDLKSGQIKGVETLVRWKTDDAGIIPPNVFIPVLEETGLIVPVGEWIISQAYSDMEKWIGENRLPVSMAINLSVKQLDDPGFYEKVHQLIESGSVPPGKIHFEITESLLLDDIDGKIEMMDSFRKLGLKLSIDDFGTGYSSLGYLSKLPLDELKIDRSFIADVVEDKDSQAIVSSIIFLARSIGLSTVAEGVETKEQLHFLKGAGCDQYQGFYFSRPIPENEVVTLFQKESEVN